MDLKRAILSPGMLAAVVIGTLMLTQPTWSELTKKQLMPDGSLAKGLNVGIFNSNYFSFYQSAFFNSGFTVFCVVLCVLPCVITFCDELNTGYIKTIVMRSGIGRHLRNKIICSAISGGVAIAVPAFLVAVFTLIVAHPFDPSTHIKGMMMPCDGSVFHGMDTILGSYFPVLLQVVLLFIQGAVWSMIGLAISAFITNRYVALAAPFILYFALNTILLRARLIIVAPELMSMGEQYLLPSFWYVIAYQLILFSVVAFLFVRKAKRRLHDV